MPRAFRAASFRLTIAGRLVSTVSASACMALLAASCAPIENDEALARSSAELIVSGSLEERAVESLLGECSTDPVFEFSRTIVEELRCMHPDLFVDITNPPRDTPADLAAFPRSVTNIVVAPNAHPLLQRGAAEALFRAASVHPEGTLYVNHALRTPVQQFLLYRQFQLHTCRIKAAAPPGSSNHERGISIDINQALDWRLALEDEGFEWLGENDPMHFDYRGPEGTEDIRRDGVEIVQRAWNLAFEDDQVPTDGRYRSATAQRFEQLPITGLDESPICLPQRLEDELARWCPDRERMCVLNTRCRLGDDAACEESRDLYVAERVAACRGNHRCEVEARCVFGSDQAACVELRAIVLAEQLAQCEPTDEACRASKHCHYGNDQAACEQYCVLVPQACDPSDPPL